MMEKSEVTHIKELDAAKSPGFGAKLKAHLKKFWWLHLIIFISCTLIIVLCLSVSSLPELERSLEIEYIN